MVPGCWVTDGERDPQDILAPTRAFQPGLYNLQQMIPVGIRRHRGSNKRGVATSGWLDSNFDHDVLEVDGWQKATTTEVHIRSQGRIDCDLRSPEEFTLSPVGPLSKEYLIDSSMLKINKLQLGILYPQKSLG
ncbi:hypothetical protein HYALB_00008080 [Hymenoscyphus albidus]|uniref:Uncharacterized protein n=1 Tax=Hymenoscyphus albidus TaxID=595503 RepID=A0A9N9LMJ2_9HELO|nr:hypothetical protein HYALB_00008080 [Hymenoscyphus albidus]